MKILFFALGLLAEIVSGAERPTINILYSDMGVYRERPEVLRNREDSLFAPLPSEMSPLDSRVARANTITIPMPEGLPARSTPEFRRYVDILADGIHARLRSAATTGGNYEIRTVQDITINGGYFDPFRQEKCIRFSEVVLRAVETATDRLKGHANVSVSAMVGSNGGHVTTEVLNRIGRPLFERLFLVDARAYTQATLATSLLLGGRVTIVNTGGDAPAFADMISHLEGARWVQARDQRVQIVYIDPEGWNLPSADHLALFATQARMTQVKTLEPSGQWSKTETVDLPALRQRMIDSAGNEGGVSLSMEGMRTRESVEAASLRRAALDQRAKVPDGAVTLIEKEGGRQ